MVKRKRQPGQTEFSVYVMGRCVRMLLAETDRDTPRVEQAAIDLAVGRWKKLNRDGEVTIVRSDDVGIDAIQHWHPITTYGAEALVRRVGGRLLSWAAEDGRQGRGMCHLSALGESRYLTDRFGRIERIETSLDAEAGWVEFRTDARGTRWRVGRNVDVTVGMDRGGARGMHELRVPDLVYF